MGHRPRHIPLREGRADTSKRCKLRHTPDRGPKHLGFSTLAGTAWRLIRLDNLVTLPG